MELIFSFLIGTALFAMAGHVLWLAILGLFQGLARMWGPEQREPILAEMCPVCGEAWKKDAGLNACPMCTWSKSGPITKASPNPDHVLAVLRARALRYTKAGLITADECAQMIPHIVGEKIRPQPVLQTTRPLTVHTQTVPPEQSRQQPVPKPVTQPPAPNRPPLLAAAQNTTIEQAQPERSAAPAAERTQPWLGLFSRFLEASNIRWGEVVGGLLIVGCSLALVISFWSSIAEQPLLKFGLFNGVTALLYLVGIRAEKRWALPNTARGLFVIGTLLVPLNFLAIAAFSRGSDPGWLATILGDLAAIGLSGWLTFRAGQSLVPRMPAALTLGVLVPSLAMLLGRVGFGTSLGSQGLLAMAALPYLGQGAAIGGFLARSSRTTESDESLAHQLLRLLGLTCFAATIALGLLIAREGPVLATLHRLSPLAPLVSAPVLATGLFLWQRMRARELVSYRTAGTAIATAAILLMLAGAALGWPQPAKMMPGLLLSCAVLAAVALVFQVPAIHILAGFSLMLAYLLAWHVAAGDLGWTGVTPAQTTKALLSGQSGSALVPFVLLTTFLTGLGVCHGRRPDARALAMVASLAGLISLGLIDWLGIGLAGNHWETTWVLGTYALLALASAAWFGRNPLLAGGSGFQELTVLTWLGSGLLLATLLQSALSGTHSLSLPWTFALLAHATLCALGAGLLRILPPSAELTRARMLEILEQSARLSTLASTIVLVAALPVAGSALLAARLLWLAGLWLALAWHQSHPVQFGVFQAALAASITFDVGASLRHQAWFAESARPWLDPWTIQAVALTLGLVCLGWIAVRVWVQKSLESNPERSPLISKLSTLLNPPWPAFDRTLRAALALVAVMLAVYGAAPGILQEVSQRSLSTQLVGGSPLGAARVVAPATLFEIAQIPHRHALGIGSWGVLGMAILVLLAGNWERFRQFDTLLALATASLAALLWAGRWEVEVAAATAFFWVSTVVLLGLSILIWNRQRLALLGTRLGWQIDPFQVKNLTRNATCALFLAVVGPLAIIFGHVTNAALVHHRPPANMEWAWGSSILSLLVLGAVAAFLQAWSRSGFDTEPKVEKGGQRWIRPAAWLVLLLGIFPCFAISAFILVSILDQDPMVGPEPGSTFARLGQSVWSLIPLVVLAITLLGYAIRDRSARFAFAAGLMINLAATVGYIVPAAEAGRGMDAMFWVQLAQLNASVAAIYALAWIGTVRGWLRRYYLAEWVDARRLQTTLVLLSIALNTLLLAGGATMLFLNPVPGPVHQAIAGPGGLLSLGLALGGFLILVRLKIMANSSDWLGLWLLNLVIWLATGLVTRDTGNWLAYRGLLVGWILVGFALPLFAWHNAGLKLSNVPATARLAVVRWGTICLALGTLFGLGSLGSSRFSSWWSVGPLLSMVVLSALLAAWSTRPRYITVTGILGNIAATIWWQNTSWAWAGGPLDPWSALVNLLNVNIVALAAPVAIWHWLDRRFLQPARSKGGEPWPGTGHRFLRLATLPFPRIASWMSLVILALVVALSVDFNLYASYHTSIHPSLSWLAIAAVAAAFISALWDGREKAALAGLYLLGLCACGLGLDQLQVSARWLTWTATMVLSAYSVLASYLWNQRLKFRNLANRLGIPQLELNHPEADLTWLVPANLLLAAGVITLAFGSILTEPELVFRSATAQAAVAEVLAIGLLAQGARRWWLQGVALGVGVIGAVAWGWASIPPTANFATLDRFVVVLVALIGTSSLYGLGLSKLFPMLTDWAVAARKLVPSLLALAALTLAVIFTVEVQARWNRSIVPISAPSIVAMALAILGAAVAAILAAVVPGRDPFGLSERGRTAYVYACEGLLAALLLHLGMTLPWLFTGIFAQYWPLIVVGLAFLGAGLSEFFRRKGQTVLADPVANTGALLPLLPLLSAFWTIPKPGEDLVFLVLCGGLYATFSLLRSSPGFAMLSTLVFNAALWSQLGRLEGFGLAQHPQLWVIPPALCVLVATYLNRERLSELQTAILRQGAALAIYLSSTADIILTGVAQSPWLPLVLALLSIAGIFLGILLQIRNFLLLGMGFLTLAVFSIIWYAAVDLHQTWIWWACGIMAGILILALFAVFEKKRTEILSVVDQVKLWKA